MTGSPVGLWLVHSAHGLPLPGKHVSFGMAKEGSRQSGPKGRLDGSFFDQVL